MSTYINLIKLSVGSENIEGLEAWQSQKQAQTSDGLPRHITRMWPRRADELLSGGSIYWVIKGEISCRQRVRRLDEVIGQDGISRCAIVLDARLIPVQRAVRRPFQGWRYLAPSDAPPDIPQGRGDEPPLPAQLNQVLGEIGLL